MKNKWFLSHWFIAFLFLLRPIYGIPLAVGIILAAVKTYYNKKSKDEFAELNSKYTELQNSHQSLESSYQELNRRYTHLDSLGYDAILNEKNALQEESNSLSATISQQEQVLNL